MCYHFVVLRMIEHKILYALGAKTVVMAPFGHVPSHIIKNLIIYSIGIQLTNITYHDSIEKLLKGYYGINKLYFR